MIIFLIYLISPNSEQHQVSPNYTSARSPLKRMNRRGGHWDFRFCGFGYFLDRFFGFCCKRLRFFGFGGHCGLRIFRFLASGFRFSWKILAVFQFWYPMWFLVFGRAVCFFEYLFITTLNLRASSCCHVKPRDYKGDREVLQGIPHIHPIP